MHFSLVSVRFRTKMYVREPGPGTKFFQKEDCGVRMERIGKTTTDNSSYRT